MSESPPPAAIAADADANAEAEAAPSAGPRSEPARQPAAGPPAEPPAESLAETRPAAVARDDARRAPFMAFVADVETAHAVRAGLASAFADGFALHVMPFARAIEHLAGIATPRIILVDIADAEQPLTAMLNLEPVVDAGTRVLVVGRSRSAGVYRSLTRSLGVAEYLPKPLEPAAVAAEFLPWVTGGRAVAEADRGGSVIAVCATSGGVGGSTVALNLAWMIGVESRRNTILLDTELQRGTGSLGADTTPSTGLRVALEMPQRIDPLLIERAAQPAAERFHILAAEEPLAETCAVSDEAGRALIGALRRRYNFIVADIAARPLELAHDVLRLAHRRVLVIDPGPQGIAAARRWLAIPHAAAEAGRPLIVVNRHRRGTDPAADVIAGQLGHPVTATIPDLPRQVNRAAALGQILAARRGPLRNAVTAICQAMRALNEVAA